MPFCLPLPPVPSLYILHLNLLFTKRELWGVCLVGGHVVLLSHMELTYIYILYLTLILKIMNCGVSVLSLHGGHFKINIHYTLLIRDYKQLLKTLFFIIKVAQKCSS